MKNKRNTQYAILITLILAWLILPQAAQAATYYLDAVNGNDSNPGTSELPWKTLARTQAILVAGDTLKVRNGSYGSFAITSSSPYGTSWSAPITYIAETGHNPTFAGITIGGGARDWYLIFDGLTVTGTAGSSIVYLKDSSALKIRNCTITGILDDYAVNSSLTGVEMKSTTSSDYNDVLIDNCVVSTAGGGISLTYNFKTGIIISNNTIHNIGGSAISINGNRTRENDTVIISGNHIYHQQPCITEITVTGTKSGTFTDGETVIQTDTGASGTINGQDASTIRITVKAGAHFITGSGKTITGQNSGQTLTNPSEIKAYAGDHGTGISIRNRNITVKNNIIHDYGNTRGIRCYQSVYDGESGRPSGGYYNMLFENNLVYDMYNWPAEFIDAGDNFKVMNNTFIGYHGLQTGVHWYNAAMTIGYAPGVSSGIIIANNVLVGENGVNSTTMTVTGNQMYSCADGGTFVATIAGNTIYQAGSGEHATNFVGSGNFFVGGADFDTYSIDISRIGGPYGINLNNAYKLSNVSPAIGYANSSYAPSTDILGNTRDAKPDAGCYEYIPESVILYGDVNSDGEISAFDAALAAHIAVDLAHPDIKNRAAADVNGDGEVTAYDAALIAQRAVGLIEKFPI